MQNKVRQAGIQTRVDLYQGWAQDYSVIQVYKKYFQPNASEQTSHCPGIQTLLYTQLRLSLLVTVVSIALC